jgi:hypothetical protein
VAHSCTTCLEAVHSHTTHGLSVSSRPSCLAHAQDLAVVHLLAVRDGVGQHLEGGALVAPAAAAAETELGVYSYVLRVGCICGCFCAPPGAADVWQLQGATKTSPTLPLPLSTTPSLTPQSPLYHKQQQTINHHHPASPPAGL